MGSHTVLALVATSVPHVVHTMRDPGGLYKISCRSLRCVAGCREPRARVASQAPYVERSHTGAPTRDAKASSPPKAFADQPHRDRQPDGLAEGEALGRPDDVRRGAARRAKRAVSELGRHVQ